MTHLFRIVISLVFIALLDRYSCAVAAPVAPKPSDPPGLRLLEEIQTVITDLAESAKPSVVNLFPLSGPGRGREPVKSGLPMSQGQGQARSLTLKGTSLRITTSSGMRPKSRSAFLINPS